MIAVTRRAVSRRSKRRIRSLAQLRLRAAPDRRRPDTRQARRRPATMRVMCDGPILEKVRHCVPYAGVIWNVDVYEGILSGVVIAEVELDRADQDLQLPDWIGPEVTGDPNYRKINMIARRNVDNREKHSAGPSG